MTQDAMLQFSGRSDRPHLVLHRMPSRVRHQSRIINLQTLPDHTIQQLRDSIHTANHDHNEETLVPLDHLIIEEAGAKVKNHELLQRNEVENCGATCRDTKITLSVWVNRVANVWYWVW